jgi:type IV pilus assembly protein PilO
MRIGIRELILLLILLGLPTASFFLVFRPENRDIDGAKREIEHKRSVLLKLREETAKSKDLARTNKEIQDRIEAIEARLPSKKEVEAVVRQVADLAVAAGLEVPQLKSGKALKTASYMEQPLELSTQGAFNGFYDFLLKLEQLARITRMTDLKIKRNEETDGVMQATFTLSIYYQDEQVVTK